MDKEYDKNAQSENKYGEWVPSIPFPYYGFLRVRCQCGEYFRNESYYRGHFALKHILGL